MIITRIKGADTIDITKNLKSAYDKIGYDTKVSVKGSAVNVSGFRLGNKYVEKYGRNVSPYSGRKGRILNWDDWVIVNDTTNRVLDDMKVSANVKTLKGKFKIRQGMHKFTRSDWESLADENVGSRMMPIARRDAWKPESEEKRKKLLEEVL